MLEKREKIIWKTLIKEPFTLSAKFSKKKYSYNNRYGRFSKLFNKNEINSNILEVLTDWNRNQYIIYYLDTHLYII